MFQMHLPEAALLGIVYWEGEPILVFSGKRDEQDPETITMHTTCNGISLEFAMFTLEQVISCLLDGSHDPMHPTDLRGISG